MSPSLPGPLWSPLKANMARACRAALGPGRDHYQLTSDTCGQQPGPGQGESIVVDVQVPQQNQVLL